MSYDENKGGFMKKIKLTALLVAGMLMLTACNKTFTYPESKSKTDAKTNASSQGTTIAQTKAPLPEPIKEDSVVNFVAVGDNLIHNNIYEQAKNRANGNGYDFSYVYESVKDVIKNADLSFINQETVVNNLYKPSGYPRFSTPTDMGDCLEDLGFDAVSIINNHTLDVNSDGLLNSLDYWATKKNMTVFGAYRNATDYANIRTMEKNGIKFAFLGVTEHTNGIKRSASSEVELLYIGDDDKKIEERLKKAREIADVVVIAPHFGVEVSDIVSDTQKKYSKKFADWGADVILGTQPHTIQPIEIIKAADGRDTLLFNCLGNFVSSMSTNVKLSMIGMIGEFTVTKNGETGKISFSKIAGIPIISYYDNNFGDARIIPYKDFTADLAAKHGGNKYANISMDFLDKQIKKILGDYLKMDLS